MKRISLIILLFGMCFLIVGCQQETENEFDPWDNLGGGDVATDGEQDDVYVDEYNPEEATETTSAQEDESSEGAFVIDLNNLGELPKGVALVDTTITISEKGAYILKGTFSGNIVVKECNNEDVRVILDNVNITSPDTHSSSVILFEKTSGLRVLTIKENTSNYLTDSINDTDDEAVICAKKSSLTINGKGSLYLNGVAEKSSGIKVKKELTILNSNIEITCNNNGIKADNLIIIKNSSIVVLADGDGIKTDKEATTIDEANEYTSNKYLGYIYLENTNLNVISGDDGLSSNNGMYINNKEENLIKIVTNNGAPSNITEYSSDNADGKAIKVDGITYVDETTGNEEDWPASYDENYSLVIIGGTFDINSNDDAITSKGNLIINGGTYSLSSGDDAIHAEYSTIINNGNIEIKKSYEGIEGASVEIFGGNISVVSTDDGINAANKDLTGYDYHIYINGGNTFVNAQGDGVDSNGWFKMDSGTLTIFGPTNGGNGSLDSDKGVLINGGTLVAVGSSGMVERPSSNSEKCYISINLKTSQNANTKITIYNENGEEIYTVTPTKKYQSVIVSLEEFELNKTYKVVIGEETYEATLEKIGTALGTNQFGGGNQGFRPPKPR